MTFDETKIYTLASLFGLNVRSIDTGDNACYQIGEGDGGLGSYGLDAIASYQTWNDRWSGRGGLTLTADKVALYLAAWQANRDALPEDLATKVGLNLYS